jgi:hypothetical protein
MTDNIATFKHNINASQASNEAETSDVSKTVQIRKRSSCELLVSESVSIKTKN